MTLQNKVKQYLNTKKLEEKFNTVEKWISVYQTPDGEIYCRHCETGQPKTVNDGDVEIYRVEENNEKTSN